MPVLVMSVVSAHDDGLRKQSSLTFAPLAAFYLCQTTTNQEHHDYDTIYIHPIPIRTLSQRRLRKHHKHKRNEPSPTTLIIDYTEHSCDAINELQVEYPTLNRCQFAKECNDGDGILFPSLFCTGTNDAIGANNGDDADASKSETINSTPSSINSPYSNDINQNQQNILLLILLSLTLLLLFRLLNSTTDEFFSPGLELFSLHFGLPPRFAGVTLLALGNGAPDVAATMNAMLEDEKRGYQMAVGELTGTSMFVSGVILGVIVSLSGSGGGEGSGDGDQQRNGEKEERRAEGVPCKGPLLRDIAVLVLVLVVTMKSFERGVIDTYHLFYHLPKLAREESSGDISILASRSEEQVISVEYGSWKRDHGTNEGEIAEHTPLVTSSSRSDGARSQQHQHHNRRQTPHNHSLGDTVIEAMSNYSCHDDRPHHRPEHASKPHDSARKNGYNTTDKNNRALSPVSTPAHLKTIINGTGWAPLQADGIEPIAVFHPHHAIHPHHEGGPIYFRRASSVGSNGGVEVKSLSQAESSDSNDWMQIKATSSGDRGTEFTMTDTATPRIQCVTTKANICADYGNDEHEVCRNHEHIHFVHRPNSWAEAWDSNIREWNEHWADFFNDIYRNKDNSVLDVLLLSVELPFTIIRKLTNPVPCDGYYCRPLVAISFAISPFWLWLYFLDQFGVDIFATSIGYILSAVHGVIALCVLRHAPDGDGPLDFSAVVPLTLYGFCIAATWLDSIADKLVELLVLFGILLRIPNTIMGLTVLAFGNSLQDLIANVSISKKGLSTMAVTACLAGPIFNLCIGMGMGFWALLKSTGKNEIEVKFPTNLKTGFYFTIANMILLVFSGVVIGNGTIGRGYGYVACGLYVVYVVTSLYV
eukprot:scaffold1928_cov109-Alexandrium_tamarense.AAC.50